MQIIKAGPREANFTSSNISVVSEKGLKRCQAALPSVFSECFLDLVMKVLHVRAELREEGVLLQRDHELPVEVLVGGAQPALGFPLDIWIKVKAHSHDRHYLRCKYLVNDGTLGSQHFSLKEENARFFKLSWIRVDLAHGHAQLLKDQPAHGAEHCLDANVAVKVIGPSPLLLRCILLEVFAAGASILIAYFCSE